MTTALRYPPGPPQYQGIFGKIRLFLRFRGNLLQTVLETFNTYGDLYDLHIENSHIYVTRDPEHLRQALVEDPDKYNKDATYKNPDWGLAFFIGNGLLTSDGSFWRRQRKLIQPSFHARHIESYAETMVELAERTVAEWRGKAETDVDDAMMKLTLAIVSKTIFGKDVSGDSAQISEALTVLQHTAGNPPMLPAWVPSPRRKRQAQALKQLDDVVYRLIAERREDTSPHSDLLSLLLDARDEDGQGMTDQQVRDEAVTIMLAGHETTANALNWTWVLLAQNPDVEAKLHAELDTVLGGRTPTLADLKQLPYTDMVIKEAMRLYPPAYGFSRIAVEPTTIGDYDVPKGTILNLYTYGTHRDPKLWDEPEAFRPERFSPEAEKLIPRYAYLPFGGGPRVCIGNSFAMMEARLLLATLAQHYRLRLAPGQVVPTDPLITLRPKGGLHMRLEKRQPAPQPAQAAAEATL
jgi:cytochrome P450